MTDKQYVGSIEKALKPKEAGHLEILVDNRTGAKFIECHLQGSKLIAFGTIDVPLDPESQSEYRANREMITNAPAFKRMKEDAIGKRAFSNIVAEFSEEFDEDHPLKIIGGQHRFQAIKEALDHDVDEWHGVKLYFDLTKDQRLDVQLISNTSIAISPDLYDRMQETVRGPDLRAWCQSTGLLEKDEDFTDKRQRGGAISVQYAKTFILNYFAGRTVEPKRFSEVATNPLVAAKGQEVEVWEEFLTENPNWQTDKGLAKAGKEFAKLDEAQRAYFESKKSPPDQKDKAMNLAVLAAWAFVAGCLAKNKVRLERHFALRLATKTDPLNASVLAEGRHKSDAANYRGLGYRTDSKERGRFSELFFYQSEQGDGISEKGVNVAIKRYHAKQAFLEARDAETD